MDTNEKDVSTLAVSRNVTLVLPVSPSRGAVRIRNFLERNYNRYSPTGFMFGTQRDKQYRQSLSIVSDVAKLIGAGDFAGLDNFLSELSHQQRDILLTSAGVMDAIASEIFPLMLAVERGNVSMIRVVLKWIPEGKVGSL